ncbi:hypothetical protein C3941_07145 [Kaistia algarum]|uniref:hypothetical protein n=1 Tax=Kaistia algarum TaxID=2083279 RepID=UPI000CE92EDC|nr:hypothetical protein [Kaistia algarum]MCX5515548.1 hypothetical protein [Kaistia algarum]PPE81052.1 hypothetical protein C3941_07145 [Kaistia algarum]
MDSARDFILEFKRCGWRGMKPDPFETVRNLITTKSPLIYDVAAVALRELEELPIFVTVLLDHLEEKQLAELGELALELRTERASDAQLSVLSAAAYQLPSVLGPHLARLYEFIEPFSDSLTPAWRAADAAEVARLERLLDQEDPIQPLMCLFETSDIGVIDETIGCHPAIPSRTLQYWSLFSALHVDQGHTTRLTVGPCHHLHFEYEPDAYNQEVKLDRERVGARENLNPTLNLTSSDDFVRAFGGALEDTCGICGGELHKLMDLSGLPAEFRVSAPRLVLATCLSCLFWEQHVLSYEHDDSGLPHSLDGNGEFHEPKFPAEPLAETVVRVSQTPSRWQEQRWGEQNINRLGGRPTWVQEPDFPNCPKCQIVMPFIAQFDSLLATRSGYEWLWGSGGVGYFFWCDNCRVSASILQCT